MKIKRQKSIFGPCLLLTLTLSVGSAHAQTGPSYKVQVVTSTLLNQVGYFQIAFDPGNLGSSLDATASVTGFSTDGTLNPAAPDNQVLGAVTGSLPSDVTIDNTDPSGVNADLEGITFGTTIDFDVALSGPALDPSQADAFGSTFSVSLYDMDGNPLLTTAADDDILDIAIGQNATVTTQTYPTTPNGLPAVVVMPLGGGSGTGPTPTPEPASCLTLVTGMLSLSILGLIARRRGTA